MKKKWLEAVAVLLAPLGMLLLLEGSARGNAGSAFSWLVEEPLLAALNYLMLLGLCLLLTAFRSRRVRALGGILLALLSVFFGVANYYKLLYRLEPVLWTDVTQLGDAAATVGGLDFQINTGLLWGLGLAAAALAALCAVLLRGKRTKRSAVLPIAGALLLAGVPFLCTFELAGGGARYDMADQARHDGCLYTAFAMENYRRSVMRVDYSQEKTENAYRTLQEKAEPLEEKEMPNVILVLSESFTDQNILEQYLDFTTELTPFYNSLLSECRHGTIYVPKVGGGTSETEFEVLTGLKSQYTINPYSMGLPEMNSAASILREKGYAANAVHWYAGVYYNRYENLQKLGFESFRTTDTTDRGFHKIGMFVSDRDHYAALTELMGETEERDFLFCLTMQNHGGYGYDDFRQTYGASVPFTNSLSEETLIAATNYCYLLSQTDAALKEWIGELRDYPEPVTVIFFGDHLAPLGMNAYEELGVPLGGAEARRAPYFIWSNREALSGEENLSAYQLMPYALSLLGLNDDPFFHYVEELRQSGQDRDEIYDLLSYDALFGKQYAYRLAGLSPACTDFQVGGKMELLGFDAAEIGDRIFLRPLLRDPYQKHTLLVNGQPSASFSLFPSDGPLTLQVALNNGNGKRMNQSETLRYADSSQLLEESGTLNVSSHPVSDFRFQLKENKWYKRYVLFQSEESFDASSVVALDADGNCWNWQPFYGLSRAGQYALDEQGRLLVAVAKSELNGLDGSGAREYFQKTEARLWLAEE